LIVVDNGSSDGTAAYFQGVQDVAPFRVEVITSPENRGFLAACNQGLKVARGEHLVLLNHDAVVTDAWLDRLRTLAGSKPEIGMVGPMSNHATPPQRVEDATYTDLDAMQRFAARWRAEHLGRWRTVEKLSSFCLLMKRRLLEAIGGLDERFGPGFFDDDDLALRARRAGFELAVADDLFIHHFGSRTFAGAGIDAEKPLEENGDRFTAKWGFAEGQGPGRRLALLPRSAPERTAPTERPKVSLTMIVRNEEANLPACLESACDLFDEIVIVDTGSTDHTVEIARSFGARVFDFVWVDDFAAARNSSLARATGDYAFWLDADDILDASERLKLKALFDNLGRDGEAAYVVRSAWDPDNDGDGGQTVVDHIRLFPLRPDVRWTYRVHEQILPSLHRANVPVRWTDIIVRQAGYTDVAFRRRKLKRDEAILLEELADRPHDPFILFNLGSIAIERRDWRTAIGYLRKSLAGSVPTDSITRSRLYALIARGHQMLGEQNEALAACASGLAVDPDDAKLLFREAVIRRNLGDPAGAERCLRRVLSLRRTNQFRSVDQGIYGHLTCRSLASLAEQCGDLTEADRLRTAVLAECSRDRDALASHQRSSVGTAAPFPQAHFGIVVTSGELKSRETFGAFLNRHNLLGHGAEIGVENGYFARRTLDLWQGRLLYLVDIWQYLDDYEDVTNAQSPEQIARFRRTIENVSPHWHRVRLIQERSENAATMISDGSLDWVYLDANHEYSHILQDLKIWSPKVREGGLIAGHDFLDEELLINGVRTVFGVKHAVTEFFPGRRIGITNERFPTWYVIKESAPVL